jgi:hypothetical protein
MLGLKFVFKCILISLLFTSPFLFSKEQENTLQKFWNNIKLEGSSLLEQSYKFSATLTKELANLLDFELSKLNSLKDKTSEIDVRDKIDTIRIYVDEISDLKKKELKASSFTIISKSKKDYRISIDRVLQEIEPILFDGEVVDYSSKIRITRKQIEQLKKQKASLNEDLLFAPEKGSLLKSSQDEIRVEISRIDELIVKSNRLIDELEFDLKRKMSTLGIQLTRNQIKVMTTRVDGDELARSFAIFDVTKQISNTLGKLVKENSFNSETTVKYYGTYVILSEILGFSQREYINKVKFFYLPALKRIEKEIEDSINFAENALKKAKSQTNKNILRNNISSNKFSLEVVSNYKKILLVQITNLEDALERTREQISVAYSTYDTAANSANLVNLISETQDEFNKIMIMQVPDIIPFENSELELKFQEISDQIIFSS